jgi:hypothetical protein
MNVLQRWASDFRASPREGAVFLAALLLLKCVVFDLGAVAGAPLSHAGLDPIVLEEDGLTAWCAFRPVEVARP